MTGFFCKHSCRDMKRSKCNFCLAFCSVLIVVISTLVIKTITHKGPIVFLKLGEEASGQYDAIFTPTGTDFDQFNDFENQKIFINSTQVDNIYNTTYNLSPRK